jgi:nucleoid-associated protein EbfC
MFDILNKFGDLRKKMEEIKSRLDAIYIDEHTADKLIRVTVTGNRKIKSIFIDSTLMQVEKNEEVQELLEITLNRALSRAEEIAETEMKSAGRDLLPGFPGL